MNAIPRDQLKFRPMSNGQGRAAQLPNGGKVYDWDQAHFAYDRSQTRFERRDVDGSVIATGPDLASVMPELADDRLTERLRRAGRAWAQARDVERAAADAAYAAIVDAVAAGLSESAAARIAGVDRMTVRRALGKGR